ncbi:DUF6368 family protein [Nonomuraea sp. NPDC050310]|uniref:DUF6368 family protein n=1 Tax=Nonomuraea sp. NPDC050310 TaxID=3154935 RepID=UPI0033DD14A9
MGGPGLVIELALADPEPALRRLREFLLTVSERFENPRPGAYDFGVPPMRLGVRGQEGADHPRPFLVILVAATPVNAETAQPDDDDEQGLVALIGFDPTHEVEVVAMCNDPIDHQVAAFLTAGIMDAIGGIANVELRADQVALVADLPGAVGRAEKPWAAVGATAEFLRAWAARSGFRLVK